MLSKYYLALFNPRSWNDFLNFGARIYGTTSSKIPRAKTIQIGDYLICYISRRALFVGILEIESEYYFDKTPIWQDAMFPVRFKVKPVILLPIESGLPFKKIKNDLEIFRKLENKSAWGAFFINSLNRFDIADGEYLHRELRLKSENREIPKRYRF
jgi:predicted RNA-binding protein